MARFRRQVSQRRRVQWLGGYQHTVGLPLTVPTVQGSSEVAAAWVRVPAGAFDTTNDREVEPDWTVIREINCLECVTRATATGNMGLIFGAGVIAWDGINDLVPSGVDLPLPIQSPGFDWLWWWSTPIFALLNNAQEQNAQNLFAPESMVFTKAMRKLSSGTGLLLVVECLATQDGNVGIWGFQHTSRYAYKLP